MPRNEAKVKGWFVFKVLCQCSLLPFREFLSLCHLECWQHSDGFGPKSLHPVTDDDQLALHPATGKSHILIQVDRYPSVTVIAIVAVDGLLLQVHERD